MLRGEAMSWNTCLKGQNVFTYKLALQSKPKAVVCQSDVKIFFQSQFKCRDCCKSAFHRCVSHKTPVVYQGFID